MQQFCVGEVAAQWNAAAKTNIRVISRKWDTRSVLVWPSFRTCQLLL